MNTIQRAEATVAVVLLVALVLIVLVCTFIQKHATLEPRVPKEVKITTL